MGGALWPEGERRQPLHSLFASMFGARPGRSSFPSVDKFIVTPLSSVPAQMAHLSLSFFSLSPGLNNQSKPV